jgi:hypothetical protein
MWANRIQNDGKRTDKTAPIYKVSRQAPRSSKPGASTVSIQEDPCKSDPGQQSLCAMAKHIRSTPNSNLQSCARSRITFGMSCRTQRRPKSRAAPPRLEDRSVISGLAAASIVPCINLRANWIKSFSRSWVRKGATFDPGFGIEPLKPVCWEDNQCRNLD